MEAGDNDLENAYADHRKQNDQAYFLFMYTRVEGALKKRESVGLSNKKAKKLRVMDCAAKIFGDPSSEYTQLENFKNERNAIAHGGSFISQIVVASAAQIFEDIYKEI